MSLVFVEDEPNVGSSFYYGPISIKVLPDASFIRVSINGEPFYKGEKYYKYHNGLMEFYNKINSIILGTFLPTDRISIWMYGDDNIANDADLKDDMFTFYSYSPEHICKAKITISYSENKIEIDKYFNYLLKHINQQIEYEKHQTSLRNKKK